MSRLVTFGEIMTRFRTPGFKRIRQCMPGQMEVSFAGAEANVAASVALFGGDASFATALPDNPIGDACIAFLKSFGVDVSRIQRLPNSRIGAYFIETGANQRASTVVYDRADSAVAVFPSGGYRWKETLEGAGWFHTTGITLALSEQSAQAAIDAARTAKESGLTVSCDLNFRSKLWRWGNGPHGKELARKTMPRLLEYVDVLIGNESDADDVMGIRAGDSNVESGELDVARYEDVAEQIVAAYPNIGKVAITLRESLSATHNRWGAMLYCADERKARFFPSRNGVYEPLDIQVIVDRVGAGDSFSAALIFALMDENLGVDPERSLAFAVSASALCHSIDGDFNMVTRSEVEALAGGDASGRVKR